MKQLLILLLFPIAGLGQTEAIKIDTTGRLIFNEIDSTGKLLFHVSTGTTTWHEGKPVMDTARVMIVYADTTSSIIFGEKYYSYLCGWQFGYEVSEKRFFAVLQMEKPFYTIDHVAYLDEKKKPLSKSVVVFMSLKAE